MQSYRVVFFPKFSGRTTKAENKCDFASSVESNYDRDKKNSADRDVDKLQSEKNSGRNS